MQGLAAAVHIVAPVTRAPARRLAEVAKKVGVSEATVSRVLNGKAGVSDATREAVLTALDVLGYERPTQLRGERGAADRPGPARTAEPDLPGAGRGDRRGGWRSAVSPPSCAPARRAGCPRPTTSACLLDQHASGLVFAGGHFAEADAPHDHYRLLHSRGIPVVLLNAAVDDLDFPARVHTTTRSRPGRPSGTCPRSGHQRIGLVVGPEDHVPSGRKGRGLSTRA